MISFQRAFRAYNFLTSCSDKGIEVFGFTFFNGQSITGVYCNRLLNLEAQQITCKIKNPKDPNQVRTFDLAEVRNIRAIAYPTT